MYQPTYLKIWRYPQTYGGTNELLGVINGSELEAIEWGNQTVGTGLEAVTVRHITGNYSLSTADHDFSILITALDSVSGPNDMKDTYGGSPEDIIKIMNIIVDQIVQLIRRQEMSTVSNVADYYPPRNCDLGSMALSFNPYEPVKEEEKEEEVIGEGPAAPPECPPFC
mgnify:CR=1 FL=1|jgi:hypothetical protein